MSTRISPTLSLSILAVPGVTGITTYLAFQTFSQEMLDEAFHIGLD